MSTHRLVRWTKRSPGKIGRSSPFQSGVHVVPQTSSDFTLQPRPGNRPIEPPSGQFNGEGRWARAAVSPAFHSLIRIPPLRHYVIHRHPSSFRRAPSAPSLDQAWPALSLGVEVCRCRLHTSHDSSNPPPECGRLGTTRHRGGGWTLVLRPWAIRRIRPVGHHQ